MTTTVVKVNKGRSFIFDSASTHKLELTTLCKTNVKEHPCAEYRNAKLRYQVSVKKRPQFFPHVDFRAMAYSQRTNQLYRLHVHLPEKRNQWRSGHPGWTLLATAPLILDRSLCILQIHTGTKGHKYVIKLYTTSMLRRFSET